MKFPILETNRLSLIKITKKHSNDLFEYLSQDKVTKYLSKSSLKNINEVYEIIDKLNKSYESNTSIRWGIVHNDSNKIIGTIGLDSINYKHERSEISYDLNSNYWGRGYGTEALSNVLKYGFNKLNLNRVGAIIIADNLSSINLIKKHNFKQESILREFIYKENTYHDAYLFSLLKYEFNNL